MVRRALDTVPHQFSLYDRAGNPAARYGQGVVNFDPGRPGVQVLDPDTLDTRRSEAADLARIIRVADALPAYDAVSTAVVAHDVPTEIGDLYRLFVCLVNSGKPIVTGAFTPRGSAIMIDLLAIDAGGRDALADRPRAVFDVCPSPPLTWSEFACRNVMDLARARVPAELISMPLAGVAAPVTLIGSIVQHAAETLAGIVLHQLAEAGVADRLGRRADHRRHALGLHPDGRDRDGDDRRRLRGRRQVAGSAVPRLPGRHGRQGHRRAGRATRAA